MQFNSILKTLLINEKKFHANHIFFSIICDKFKGFSNLNFDLNATYLLKSSLKY